MPGGSSKELRGQISERSSSRNLWVERAQWSGGGGGGGDNMASVKRGR